MRNGRAPDLNILPVHCLYFRINREDVLGDRINPDRIRSKDTSVNWSKYSKPWDVIFDHEGAGFARFLVRDIPEILPEKLEGNAKPHHFRPVHDPLTENYSHCEIRCFKDGVRHTGNKLPETVKKEYRQILSDRGVILSMPEV